MAQQLKVGIPKENKPMEGRIALVPHAVNELVQQGVPVVVESGAGKKSGFSDYEYKQAGAVIADSAKQLYAAVDLIVKVKEPIAQDLALLESRHLLFCYLHLAPNPDLAAALCDIGLTAVAFETVRENGGLPLLAPMSEIAGRVAVQAGAHLLHSSMGGRGVLLGGVTGTAAGRVVIIGAGVAGQNAAAVAAASGAQVIAFDRSAEALKSIERLAPNITGLYAYAGAIEQALQTADLLVGAVLIPGQKAPHIVTREMVRKMPRGSVIVDISVDQGGCIETIRPTDYRDPVYVDEGVLHMGVTNLPGAVPKTASEALSGALLPFVGRLAMEGVMAFPALSDGINVSGGKIVLPALLE